MTRPAGPSWEVEVEFSLGHPTYGILAGLLYGEGAVEWWENLGDLLHGRPGWHCDYTSDGLLWSYGAAGASLFNIGPPEDYGFGRGEYEVFDYDEDEVFNFPGTAALQTWLESNEHRHADHLRNLSAFVSGNDWADLSKFDWDARVTYDGSSFIGQVPKVPSEMVAGPDLKAVLKGLQELMAYAFGAPQEAARHVRVNARLDSNATAAFLAD